MNESASEIETFVRTIRRRNTIEVGVGLLMLLVFGRSAAASPAGSPAFYGHLLIVVALVFVVSMIVFVASTRGNRKRHPPDDLAFWHAEILRHARLLRLVPFWYIGPFLPGFALLLWPLFPVFARSESWIERSVVVLLLVVIAAIAGTIGRINARESTRLEELARSVKRTED
jgi:hypothetical protein